MNILEKLKQVARRGRAILQPIDSLPDHMARLTSRTAKEMGVSPEVVDLLAECVRRTCHETGLIGSIHRKLDSH
jgi:hypothetical protein